MSEFSEFDGETLDEVGRLVESRYLFHFWMNLNLLIPDGVMFNIKTKLLDPLHPHGVGHFERMKLLRITTTKKPRINNTTGFAVSNMFLGQHDQRTGQAQGIGSSLAAGTKVNVVPELAYVEEKITDIQYTFGKYGVVVSKFLNSKNSEEDKHCRDIFNAIVWSGLTPRTLLEDIPEYFGQLPEYLPLKKPARYSATAIDNLTKACREGVKVQGPGDIEPRIIRLSEADFQIGEQVIEELAVSANGAHAAALEAESGEGVLPGTRELIQTGQKKMFDKCDLWVINQFPSYEMDTMLEKSQKQLIKAIENQRDYDNNAPENEEVKEIERQAQLSFNMYEAEKAKNAEWQSRFEAQEEQIKSQDILLKQILANQQAAAAAIPVVPVIDPVKEPAKVKQPSKG